MQLQPQPPQGSSTEMAGTDDTGAELVNARTHWNTALATRPVTEDPCNLGGFSTFSPISLYLLSRFTEPGLRKTQDPKVPESQPLPDPHALHPDAKTEEEQGKILQQTRSQAQRKKEGHTEVLLLSTATETAAAQAQIAG